MKHIYLLLLTIIGSVSLAAQCYNPQSMDQRMSETDVTVVGRVIDSEPFYNNMGEIYTMHTMEVYQINGIANIPDEDSNLEFFTMGGRINEEQTIVYPSLRDIEDAEGMFLLRQYNGDRVDISGGTIYQPVAVHESYMPFNPATGEFSDGETNLGNIDQVSALVESYTGMPLNDVSGHDFAPQADRSVAVPSINSLSGTSFSAGIGEELIINGSGFGATTGDVFFDNPDDGPGGSFTAAGDEDILAWNDNRIRVRVISNAGCGRVIVRTANGMQTQSSQSIDVDFAVTNLNLTSGAIVTPLLIDDEADGNGGYIFAVSNNSANGGVSLADSPAALAALNRAVTSWQQDGDYSLYLQGTTRLQQPRRDTLRRGRSRTGRPRRRRRSRAAGAADHALPSVLRHVLRFRRSRRAALHTVTRRGVGGRQRRRLGSVAAVDTRSGLHVRRRLPLAAASAGPGRLP